MCLRSIFEQLRSRLASEATQSEKGLPAGLLKTHMEVTDEA